jgi:hypothetical protein
MEGQFIPFVPRSANLANPDPSGSKADACDQAAPSFRLVSPQATAPAVPSRAQAAKPTIFIQREGDRVTQIRVQCVCGEVIELDCVY